MRLLAPWLASAAAWLASAAAATRPNFVVLFLDDHGWGDMGANVNTTTETPNMDALANGGIRFVDFHVGFSVCTPSRAALLTGRLCPRTGVCGNFGPTSIDGMHLNWQALTERTIADVLNSGGYESHMIGKWHLGHNAPFHPTFRGFQSYLGLPYSGDMGCLDSTPQGCKKWYDRSKGQPACPALCPKDGPVPTAPTPAPGKLPAPPQCPGAACPAVPKSNYVGCFIDKSDASGGMCDLKFIGYGGHCGTNKSTGQAESIPQYQSVPDSVEQCNALCGVKLGFKYFGLQHGHACFCSDSYGAQGEAKSDKECDTKCAGNKSEICGSSSRNSVYKTEKAKTGHTSATSVAARDTDGYPWPSNSLNIRAEAAIAIPLFNSSGVNCSGHASCNDDIVQQPFDPFRLNHHYAARAATIFEHYNPSSHKNMEVPPAPFFLYVAFAHTHTPLAYDEARFGNASSRPGFAKVFGNTLSEVDDAVGQIHAALVANSLDEHTLIVMTADNGPADLGSVDCDDIGSPGPFTGAWQASKTGGGGGGRCKSSQWEGGHRMIGVAYWKGTIAPRVSHALASSLDYLPTFAALAGIPLPADRSYDGLDISGVLLRGDDSQGHATLFHPNGSPGKGWEIPGSWSKRAGSVPAMRLGQYKAHFFTHAPQSCKVNDSGVHRTGMGKNIDHYPSSDGSSVPLIFDLTADPSESTPLTLNAPGSLKGHFSDTVSAFVAAYEAFWSDVSTTMRSDTSYASNNAYSPCSNTSSACCRLYDSKI